ncbi:GNAT family N-acetyltransferase [Kordiimonas gwangyangensis]|uniref:GNAT family N-acetyltransferase n=1 Tax=Kordiimonas gwangyangensis TaxID=288022 RepID=UPI000361C3D2|nr:GNAT family N-acetyltransferase [Kordiimonas gwangyangensis]
MITGSVNLPHGMSARPARASDKDFLAKMFRENRDDIRMADNSPDYIESVIDMQLRAQEGGYGSQFPNAVYMVIEKNGTRIGRVTLDIGPVELRLVDLDFIKKVQGKGLGSSILLWLMKAAAQTKRPLLVPMRRDDITMGRFLEKYGFVEDISASDSMYARMSWFPNADEMAGITDIKPRAAMAGTV